MSFEFGHHRYHHRDRNPLASPISSTSNEKFLKHISMDDKRGYNMNSSQNNGPSFSSLSSSSPSAPASLNVPHLRHHHHSRNHGINGNTSPFLRLTQSAKDTLGSSASSESSANSSSSSMNRSNSSELKQDSGLFGESETFSRQKLNRFLPSSSSPSTSKLSLSPGSSSSMWSSVESEKNFSNMTISQPQRYHTYNHLTSHSYHYDTRISNLKNSTNFPQSFANATTSALEQFVTKSVGDGDNAGGGGMSKSSLRNFARLSHPNDGGTFLGINNTLLNLSSTEEMMLPGFRFDEANGSTDNYYFENSSAMNVSITGNISESGGGIDSTKIQLYAIIVPVMTFFCVLAVLVNLMIVISARWCRKPMSPTLYFSISLALADAYAAFVLATGLFINSFMPTVLKVRPSTCISLIVEAFRQGGILVIVCHLLSLAMNHWIGIVRPLHYAATMTRRTAWTVIIFSWFCPITVIFIYYSLVAGEGFQSEGCRNYEFLKERTYRAIFASCFFAPLILMSFIYIHIFIIVRNHHTHRQRYQSTQQLKRNVKAVLTTMLVLGTYIVGWMPATVFSLIACKDCMYQTESATMWAINISVNILVILKTLVDPIIYAARMSDIQLALKKMRYEILQKFCKSCAPAEPPNDRGYYLNSPSARTSFYDTKSMRMSSIGSRSSCRRMTTATTSNLANNPNSSLLLQTNGSQMHHHHHNHSNIPNQPSHKHNGAGGTNGYLPCTVAEGRSHSNANGSPLSNSNSRRSFGQPQLMINSKSVFEMTEIN